MIPICRAICHARISSYNCLNRALTANDYEILIPNKIEQEFYIDFRGDVLDAFICLTITLNIYKKKLHKNWS